VVTFSILVLYFRLSEKVCTPTSVICMAINSIVGFIFVAYFRGEFHVEVQNYWLAAVPVVVLGAPLGSFICNFVKRKTVVNTLLLLIGIEFLSTLIIVPLNFPVIASAVITTLIFFLFFRWIHNTEPA